MKIEMTDYCIRFVKVYSSQHCPWPIGLMCRMHPLYSTRRTSPKHARWIGKMPSKLGEPIGNTHIELEICRLSAAMRLETKNEDVSKRVITLVRWTE